MVLERTRALSSNAQRVLEERILKRDPDTGALIETPDGLFWRVARTLSQVESTYDTGRADEMFNQYREVLEQLLFLPNSPTLANAGQPKASLSACFVLPVPDSIEGIFDAVKYAAIIHQSGGGCLSGDSLVLTTRGPVRLQDLVQNEFPKRVFARQPDGTTAVAAIGQYHTTQIPAERAYAVRAAGFRLQASDWHPLFVWDGRQVQEQRTDATRQGDVLIGSSRWAGEIPALDSQWWLYGLIVSDGAFDRSVNGLRLRITKSTEAVIARAAEALGCQYHSAYDQRYQVPVWEVDVVGQRVERILGEHFGEALPRTATKVLPGSVWEASLSEQLSLLVGLLDGDGTYNKEKHRFEYATVSDRLAAEIEALAGLLGLVTTRRTRQPRRANELPLHEIRFARSPFLWDLVTSYTTRYQDIDEGAHTQGLVPLDRAYRDQLDARGYDTHTTQAWRKGVVIDGHRVALQRWVQTGMIPRMSAALILRACGEPLLAAAVHGSRTVEEVTQIADPVVFYDLTVPGSQTYLAGEGGYVVAHNTGFAFSRLRPEGSMVRSTAGVASGPVSFMKVFDSATETVKQGSKRRGANMGVLRVDHPDIEKFAQMKLDRQTLRNFNISVTVTDAFMRAVETDGMYDLVDPSTGRVTGTRRARDVWDLIIGCAWETGDPGIVFIDRVNNSKANPLPEYGPIESPNPCGEQLLYSYDSCNLGSIDLSKFVDDDADLGDEIFTEVADGYGNVFERIHTARLQWVADIATRMLDSIIDVNYYPLDRIAEVTKAVRRIGLGPMGFADLLYKLHVPYGSPLAYAVAEHVMWVIANQADLTSRQLARERGGRRDWHGVQGLRRNGALTTCAPTGTLSIIADCTGGIEPAFALAFVRQHRLEREDADAITQLFQLNATFRATAERLGFASEDLYSYLAAGGDLTTRPEVPEWVKRVYVTSHQLTPEQHVRTQAAFQKNVDSGCSKTVNLAHTATKADVRRVYELAYQLGCNGVTIYRDGALAQQVMTFSATDTRPRCPDCDEPMIHMDCWTCVACGVSLCA